MSSEIRILVVDDNILNQELIMVSLKKTGHYCEKADNGKDAYEKYMTNRFDLILMDLQMPIMTGIDSAIYIREFEIENGIEPCKIAAVTAYPVDDPQALYLAGFDDYLIKPLRANTLFDIIQKYFPTPQLF